MLLQVLLDAWSREHLLELSPHQRARWISEQVLRLMVHERDLPVRARGHDGVRRLLDQLPHTGFAGPRRRFGTFTFAHVDEETADHSSDPIQPLDGDHVVEPDAVPPGRDHPVFELVCLVLAQRFFAEPEDPVQIVRVEMRLPECRLQPPRQWISQQSFRLRSHIGKIARLCVGFPLDDLGRFEQTLEPNRACRGAGGCGRREHVVLDVFGTGHCQVR